MPTLAIDISNYTSPINASTLHEWRNAGVGLVIIQAFPLGYRQYQEQVWQVQSCEDADMPWDAYIYDYLGDPRWRGGALVGIADIIEAGFEGPRQVWLDEEDVETERGWLTAWRQDAVRNSVAAVQAAGHAVGIYTAAWWWKPYMGNTTEFSYLELWDSDFDHLPDTEVSWAPYGGWTQRRIKQHIGTSVFLGVSGVDQNVLSVEEAAELSGEQPGELELAAIDYVPQEYRDKFGATTPNDVYVNLEGIIAQVRSELEAERNEETDAEAKLARILEIVQA